MRECATSDFKSGALPIRLTVPCGFLSLSTKVKPFALAFAFQDVPPRSRPENGASGETRTLSFRILSPAPLPFGSHWQLTTEILLLPYTLQYIRACVIKLAHRRGIDPLSADRQSAVLPLNERCMARLERFELPTFCLEGRISVH